MNDSLVKAAIYVRQSVLLDEGIQRGLEGTRRMVDNRGWRVVGEYADNATSASRERGPDSDWARMLRDIEAGTVNAVVGIDMDRLLRRVVDVLKLIDLGVLIVTLDGAIDTTTAEGRRRAVDQANGAQYESEKKAERQRRANEYRRSREDGALPVPGRRRFGFLNGNKEEHPTEGPQVRWAYEAVLQGQSVYSVSKALDMTIDGARGMLRNPAYAGWLTRGTYSKGRRVSMDRIEAHKSVARIVDRNLWEKVQTVLDAKPRTSPGNKVTHLLSGLGTCVVCDKPLRSNAGGYRCPAGHTWIEEGAADREAIEELLYVLRAEEGEDVDTPELQVLNVQEAELKRQRSAAQSIALLEGADMEHLGKELVRIGKELERVDTERKALRLRTAKAELSHAVMEAWDYDGWEQDALDAWVAYFRTLPLDQQRELVRDNLTIRLDRGRVIESLSVTPRD